MAHICVINDDTEFLTLMSQLLEDEGHSTTIIREGDRAYDQIKENGPDLAILDIRLQSPETGWTILEMLTLDPATRNIPVIVCSAALDDLQAQEAWLRVHGVETLLKPFDLDDLYRSVNKALAVSSGVHATQP